MVQKMNTQTVEIVSIKGPLPKKYLKDLARLRIALFRDYPFLYDGSLAFEEKYLEPYMKSENFLLVLVFDEKKIVGASTALPLLEEHRAFQHPFIRANLNPSEFCYFGESLLDPEYRSQGIGKRFFEEREAHAHALGLPYTCFSMIDRPDNHPKRPSTAYSLKDFWRRMGYEQQHNLVANLSWKETGHLDETVKQLHFWTKKL
ncbi:Uncharacterized protein PHSC3_000304 [Chlamydiales bacterium STE3]|nr:Uncharacterized protein PHSC3_000304 [Chlamydiales bacterium STE3]